MFMHHLLVLTLVITTEGTMGSYSMKIHALSLLHQNTINQLHQFDVVGHRRLIDGTILTDVLSKTDDEESEIQALIKTTNTTHMGYRSFNLSACLELQNRRSKRTINGFSFEQYNDYNTINAWMDKLVEQFDNDPTVQKVHIADSHNGLPIFALKIHKLGSSKPAVWIDGGIHAREWISTATVIYFVKMLLFDQTHDGTNNELLDAADWYILPVFNVDGYVYSWETDRMWRKTRSPISGSDCIGTDPNRNFNSHWSDSAAVRRPCSQVYSGDFPESEPEVAGVARFLRTHPEIELYLSYHSAGQFLVTPWGWTSDKSHHHKSLFEACNRGVAAMNLTHGMAYFCTQISAYFGILPGSSVDYAHQIGIKYSFGVELRDLGEYHFCLPENQIKPTAEENFAGLQAITQFIFAELEQADSSNEKITSAVDSLNVRNVFNVSLLSVCILITVLRGAL